MSPQEPRLPVVASGEWESEIRSRLFEHRTVLLRGTLDADVANQAAAELMTLDATGDTRITVHVDLTGGTIDAAFAVMDVIDAVGVPVHILCVGRAEGPSVGIVAVGTRRACTPHSRFRLMDPRESMEGSASELARWAEDHRVRVRGFHERLAGAVRRPVEAVAADCAAGRFLTSEEALRYGIIDEVVTGRGTVYPLPARPFGFGPSR